jgi:hypothetical protein
MAKKLDWGDEVVVSAEADEGQRPGERGAVCGSRKVEGKKAAIILGLPVGTMLYQVEFDDGFIAEIAETLLKRVR